MYRTTSVLALGLFLAVAPATVYGQVYGEQETQQQTGQERSSGLMATEDKALMVDSMIGANVHSTDEDETVGSIDDVLISVDGQVEGVIIGVGGWLGVGQRDVLVSLDDLSLQARDDDLRLVMQRTREDLEADPEFVRVDEQRRMEERGQTPTPVENQVGTMQPNTTQQDTVQQDTTQQGTAELDQDEQDVAQQDVQRERTGRIVFQDDDSILASTMIGTDVQVGSGEEGENLGEISDVLISMDGQVGGVVVGVGGFLGIGEKDVIVTMDRLDIQRIEDDEVRVTVLNTREELEAADSFERPLQQQ